MTLIDWEPVKQEHFGNNGFVEGLHNQNPWGPEQGVRNASYCDSGASMVPYHHGLRWWPDCQFGEKGCAYTVYHTQAADRHGVWKKGSDVDLRPADLVFFDWDHNGVVDHV